MPSRADRAIEELERISLTTNDESVLDDIILLRALINCCPFVEGNLVGDDVLDLLETAGEDAEAEETSIKRLALWYHQCLLLPSLILSSC
jgi:hypothetical protein